jgi:NAD(P) transhydrogenase
VPKGSSYDLVVIGAGPAGEKGAARAAYFDKRVAIVDLNPRAGGIAVTTAGIPTKTLREGAIYLSGLGQRVAQFPHPSAQDPWRLLMARKVEVSEFMTKAVERNLVRHGIERIRGRARLLPGRRVEVETSTGEPVVLQAEVVLLASGSRPNHLTGVPRDDPDVHDSDSILGIERAPASLLVLGGGAVGCEYASIFAALGTRVIVLSGRPTLLSALDVEIARAFAESFNGMGIRVLTDTHGVRVERKLGALQACLADGRSFEVEKVLVAAGRCPCTEGLGLAEAGVETDAAGWVRVDERFATTVPGVFAAGDVVGPPALASVGMEQARVALSHAFGFEESTRATDRLWPTYVFAIPEVAWVGLTEEAARASAIDYETGRSSFGSNAKARMSGFPDGLIKLVFRADDKVVLGVHIVGELASELVHIGQFVMHEGGTIDRFVEATFAVPTRSEAYKYAAYDGLMRLERRRRATTLGRARA